MITYIDDKIKSIDKTNQSIFCKFEISIFKRINNGQQ